ncbi:MAG: hypothetical protein NW203_06810 [Hyphomonadaceae bacterium]|nr:hypothetical protein [Hyphomonadaceae bacterium]
MRRAIAAALIASTLLAGLSAARAQPAAAEADADAARSMDAAYIAVPVVRDGRLVNYIFVSLRVDIAPGVDLWRTREKAHFLRDALVRAAHRTPMVSAADDDALDRPVALAAFRAAAQEALGARAVRGLSIVEVQSSRQTVAQR